MRSWPPGRRRARSGARIRPTTSSPGSFATGAAAGRWSRPPTGDGAAIATTRAPPAIASARPRAATPIAFPPRSWTRRCSPSSPRSSPTRLPRPRLGPRLRALAYFRAGLRRGPTGGRAPTPSPRSLARHHHRRGRKCLVSPHGQPTLVRTFPHPFALPRTGLKPSIQAKSALWGCLFRTLSHPLSHPCFPSRQAESGRLRAVGCTRWVRKTEASRTYSETACADSSPGPSLPSRSL